MTNKPTPDILTLCAEDIMQQSLIAIPANEPLAAVERTLTEAGVSGAPVVDEQGRVLGVISTRDLLRHRSDDSELPADADASVFDDMTDRDEDPAFARTNLSACAGDLMTQEIVSVPMTTPLPLIARKMTEARVHRVLVMEQSNVAGIVSSMDVLRAIASTPQA